MTTDSDCTLGVPNSVIRRFKAEAYFEAVERALYYGHDTDAFDPSVVWHVRQYCKANDCHMPDAAELSRQRAMEHAEAATWINEASYTRGVRPDIPGVPWKQGK